MNEELIKIMEIDVTNLKEKQYLALKDHTVKVLESFLAQLRKDDLVACSAFLGDSPSGDCMGSDNQFIDFGYTSDSYLDIGEMLEMMAKLKGIKYPQQD